MMATTLQSLNAARLKDWIHDAEELALLDVREHGQYGEGHLFFAVSLPFSALELDIGRLVPRKTTRVVVMGDDATQAVVEASARVLQRLGYARVFVLDGGIAGWRAAGYATFAGVNLPSKTFGELAEHAYATPSVSAGKLYQMLQDERAKVIVLDGRPIAEYRKMNIPGSICCPNGELALRVQALAPDPDTTIVVNCAGRTRSIIGAQTLIHLNVPNKVYALENGTQGWYLADLPLEHGSNRLYPERIDETLRAAARERSAAVAQTFGVRSVDADQVCRWLDEAQHTVFLCDVRTREEYAASGLPARVQHTPGGQLIQATDQYVGVRKARIVLCDLDGIRAPVVASWLKQLGWDVFLLSDPQNLPRLPAAPSYVPSPSAVREVSVTALAAFVRAHPGAVLADARPSMAYRTLHAKGARWVIRPTALHLLHAHRDKPILLLGESRAKLMLLAADLESAGFSSLFFCVMDPGALEASGLPLVADESTLPDDACIDYLFFVHDRHQGNKEAARQYLAWETNLVSQIDAQERSTFLLDH